MASHYNWYSISAVQENHKSDNYLLCKIYFEMVYLPLNIVSISMLTSIILPCILTFSKRVSFPCQVRIPGEVGCSTEGLFC